MLQSEKQQLDATIKGLEKLLNDKKKKKEKLKGQKKELKQKIKEKGDDMDDKDFAKIMKTN